MDMSEEPVNIGAEDLHGWWDLSYAEYLTIPRGVMQSMPDEWQKKMVALLYEMDATIDWHPNDAMYWVELRALAYDRHGHAKKGIRLDDPLADYERGRRRLPLRAAPPTHRQRASDMSKQPPEVPKIRCPQCLGEGWRRHGECGLCLGTGYVSPPRVVTPPPPPKETCPHCGSQLNNQGGA
jgi:hypothetical protein